MQEIIRSFNESFHLLKVRRSDPSRSLQSSGSRRRRSAAPNTETNPESRHLTGASSLPGRRGCGPEQERAGTPSTHSGLCLSCHTRGALPGKGHLLRETPRASSAGGPERFLSGLSRSSAPKGAAELSRQADPASPWRNVPSTPSPPYYRKAKHNTVPMRYVLGRLHVI